MGRRERENEEESLRHETFDLQRGEEKIHSGKGQRSSRLTQYILSLLSLPEKFCLPHFPLFLFSLFLPSLFQSIFSTEDKQLSTESIHFDYFFSHFLSPVFFILLSFFHPLLLSSTPFLLSFLPSPFNLK